MKYTVTRSHFQLFLNRASNFEARGAVAKIGFSLKLNHHKHILLAQIVETHSMTKTKDHLEQKQIDFSKKDGESESSGQFHHHFKSSFSANFLLR